MKWCLTYCFVALIISCFSQTLPGYKNGTWWIINNGSAKALPVSIAHLGNFDPLSGTAEFIENNHYGIMNHEGKVLIPPTFMLIEPLGKGLFQCTDSIGSSVFDVNTNKTLIPKVDEVVPLNAAYVLVKENDSLSTLLFLEKRLQFTYPDSIEVLGKFWNTALVYKDDSLRSFYDQSGELIEIPIRSLEYYYDRIIYTKNAKTTVITANVNRIFPENAYVSVSRNYLSYFENGKAHLLNTQTGKIEQSVAYDKINPAPFGGYFVFKNDKIGWMNEQGALKIPVLYSSINHWNKSYNVAIGNMQGEYDEEFNLVVPVQFYSYYRKGNWVRTISIMGKNGLYSLLKQKTILEPIYSRLVFDGNLVKAYYASNIRILEINTEHVIKNDFILESALTVKQAEHSPYDDNYRFDKRLLNLGWFYIRNENLDSNGLVTQVNYKWGLKNTEDSIILKPIFTAPMYIPNQAFSLVKIKEKTKEGKLETPAYYKMRDFTNGKMFTNASVIGIDTLDCLFRSYARMATSDGLCVLMPNDSTKKVTYFGTRNGKYVPYCEGGKMETSEEEKDEFVPINYYLRNGHFSNADVSGYSFFGKQPRFQKFTGAKWNYFDTNGRDLFAESFEFAQEFYLDRAIVKRNGTWGVVSNDSLIIPFNYAEITRIPELGDSIFRVKKNHIGVQLLTKNGDIIDNSILGTGKSNGNLSIVSKGNEQLIYRNHQLENRSKSSIILLENNVYALRDKKEYSIIDANGKNVGLSNFKPDKLIGDELMIIEDKSKVGLAFISGDTIIAPGKYVYEIHGELIVWSTNTKNNIYSMQGKKITSFSAEKQLLIDPVSSTFAIVKGTTAQIYDANGMKEDKIKLTSEENITKYYAGNFFSKSEVQGGDTTMKTGRDFDYEFFANGYFAIISEEKKTDMYQNSLSNKMFTWQGSKVREIGSGIFAYSVRTGLIIRTTLGQTQFPKNTLVESKFKDGYCLLRSNGAYYFINESLKNPFNRTFMEATPFQDGAASIKLKSGWTIIDEKGIQKAYPSFGNIEQHGNGLFSARNKPTFGIIDSQGNEILSCDFEQIEVLDKGIIKVVKQGDIGYYDLHGNPIFDIK